MVGTLKNGEGSHQRFTKSSRDVVNFLRRMPYKGGDPIRSLDRITSDHTREKRGEMSAAELQERPDVEIDLVEQWRAQSLLRVGYDPEAAVVLAASHEIDLHYAMRLIERGCPVDLALQILL